MTGKISEMTGAGSISGSELVMVSVPSGSPTTYATRSTTAQSIADLATGAIDNSIHAATGKTTPVDADELALVDSASSPLWSLKKLPWANLKATAKAYFDTLYQPLDATLTALAGLTTGSNKVPYSTGTDTFGQLTLDTDGTLAANSDTTLASQKAVKTYADTKQPLDSDLTTIAGLTATTDSFMQAKSSAWAARTVAQVQADLQQDGLTVTACGFRGVPQNAQTGDYTLVAADAGKHIFHASGDGASDDYTIPANASVAYPVGTAISFINLDSNSITIQITSDTMYLAGTGSTGTRTLAQYGVATAIKVASTTWIIFGTGLT